MNPGSPTNEQDDRDVLDVLGSQDNICYPRFRAGDIAFSIHWATGGSDYRLSRALQRLQRRGLVLCEGGRWRRPGR
jgi:hypothetical protein